MARTSFRSSRWFGQRIIYVYFSKTWSRDLFGICAVLIRLRLFTLTLISAYGTTPLVRQILDLSSLVTARKRHRSEKRIRENRKTLSYCFGLGRIIEKSRKYK